LKPEDVKLRVVNPRLQTNAENMTLQFDLSHSNPDSGQAVRGYIVVLLRSGNSVLSYPASVFNLKDPAILNYTKGETFGVSRYRQVFAEFKNLPKIIGPIVFQILLFSHDGNVILSQQFVDKK
jgi:hypothetical protein